MKKTIFGFIGIACVGGFAAANGDSLLKPVSFPTTAADASFIERISAYHDGYLPYESEYDANGVCISNCAYVGIKLEDALEDIKIAEQESEIALQEHENAGEQATEESSILDEYDEEAAQEEAPERPSRQITLQSVETRKCREFIDSVPISQNIPFGYPFAQKYPITSKFSSSRRHPVTGRYQPHNGADIGAPKGTKIYTVANGTVVNSWYDSACGNGIKIVHDDKRFQTAYCHLSKRLVKKGDKVQAGCLIGLVGSTGRTTGPHLHYMVYFWSKGRYVPVNPEKGYLNSKN